MLQFANCDVFKVKTLSSVLSKQWAKEMPFKKNGGVILHLSFKKGIG
jgi:hypothetical protein